MTETPQPVIDGDAIGHPGEDRLALGVRCADFMREPGVLGRERDRGGEEVERAKRSFMLWMIISLLFRPMHPRACGKAAERKTSVPEECKEVFLA